MSKWTCVCGAINPSGSHDCHNCHGTMTVHEEMTQHVLKLEEQNKQLLLHIKALEAKVSIAVEALDIICSKTYKVNSIFCEDNCTEEMQKQGCQYCIHKTSREALSKLAEKEEGK